MNPKENEWRLSAELVRRMFDLEGDFAPSIRCPFCSGEDIGIPHMQETAFGATDTHLSGPGLLIRFECENDHRWGLRFSDHSGGTWLSIERWD